MPDVFNYHNYRAFLNDFIAEEKANHSFFSLRYIGQKVGIDAGNLVKVLQEERHLSRRYVAPFIDLCRLRGRRAEYFILLIRYCRCKSNHQARELFEQLCELKQAPARKLEAQHYRYFSEWYHAAIRSLLDYYDFKGNTDELGAQLDPPVSGAEAKRAIELLRALGLIAKQAHGRYKPTDKILSTGERWQSLAIEAFQEKVIELARQSIRRFSKEVRDISTITMNLSTEDFHKVMAVIKQCRQEILKIVDEAENSNNVYQLNMQLFPLTRQPKRGR